MDVEREVIIAARSLDSLQAEHSDLFGYGGGVDYLKIDTQGSELDILRGATRVLETTFAVELEVEFVDHYLGQPLFSDVDPFMRAKGFLLFDIAPIYWKRRIGSQFGGIRGQIVHGNALYLIEGKRFFSALAARVSSRQDSSSRLVKALDVCITFGYHDYALELLESSDLFTKDQEAVALSILCRPSVRMAEPGKTMRAIIGSVRRWARSREGLNAGYNYGDESVGNQRC